MKPNLRKGVAGLAIVGATLGLGSAVALAQDSPAPQAPSAVTAPEGLEQEPFGPGGNPADRVLDRLVADGTINAQQADAVSAALAEEFQRHQAQGQELVQEGINTVAQEIGITPEALIEQVQRGKSIAQVAEAEGVSTRVVVDALVTQVQGRLDEAVAAGDIPAEQAEQFAGNAEAMVRQLVERAPGDGFDPGGFGPGAGGGPDGPGVGGPFGPMMQ